MVYLRINIKKHNLMKHKILLILSAVFLTCFLCSSTSDTQGAASASWYINQECFAATSKDANKKLTRACNRRDQQYVSQMMINGTVVILANRTDIDMVDYGMAICQIEPLEGRYKGYNLYVNTEVVSSRR